jgi:hypothetical protein
MIPKDKVSQIIESAKIKDVVESFSQLTKSGKSYYTVCPLCKKDGKGKGLSVTPSKNMAKCFSCGFGCKPVNYLVRGQKMVYPDALKWLAGHYNINVEPKPIKSKKNKKNSYCFLQLKASGLTPDDVKALVCFDENTEKEVPVFESGTRDQFGRICPGDDMIIWYYDLDGKPVTYQKKNSSKSEHLFRVRWQNPDLHLDKYNKPIKYQSPSGSGSHLYIPELLRRAYQDGRQFKTLYLQEGEKKAEKSCNHGIMSAGIMGISNLVYNKNLPFELQLIIKRCNVQEVIFILDSDWDELSTHLSSGGSADQRPRHFFSAVKKFREFFRTYENIDIYLELYFATINKNENKEKGIDDLLAGSLKGNENKLCDDIEAAKKSNDGQGEFICVNKITTMADGKLAEFWNINSAEAFVENYKDNLKDLKKFKIGKHQWRFDENDILVLAQPLMDDEMYWESYNKMNGRGETTTYYRFRYLYAYNFFKRRGFGRYHITDDKFQFVHIDKKVVRIVDSYFIKDYAMELAKEIVPKHELVDVMDMLYRGGKMYFGPDSLSNVDYTNPVFELSAFNFQILFFKDNFWKITASGIDERSLTELENHIWRDNINDFEAKQLKEKMVDIDLITEESIKKLSSDQQTIFEPFIGQYSIDISKEGKQCHFLSYVLNTGNFFWNNYIKYNEKGNRVKYESNLKLEESFEINLHLVNKMTAFGYILHQFFDSANAKAVIGMDGKNSEVGASNGGSGKSLFGDAIGWVIPQVSIAGKNKKLTEDPFIFEEVDERTNNVFIDDIRANFDFEFLFPFITGKFTVNKKGIGKFTVPRPLTPKFYIPTNHAINGEGSSFDRRQFFISFSDYYNDKHTPVDDFHMRFFDEWDGKQWNLFYNFCALCLQTYFKYGLVEGPVERLELRRLRQQIGEEFLTWADGYYSYDEITQVFSHPENVNKEIPRKELFDDFLDKHSAQRRYVTATRFKTKFKNYCKYRNAIFNPHKFRDKAETISGADDKSGGIEYFTLADKNYNK